MTQKKRRRDKRVAVRTTEKHSSGAGGRAAAVRPFADVVSRVPWPALRGLVVGNARAGRRSWEGKRCSAARGARGDVTTHRGEPPGVSRANPAGGRRSPAAPPGVHVFRPSFNAASWLLGASRDERSHLNYSYISVVHGGGPAFCLLNYWLVPASSLMWLLLYRADRDHAPLYTPRAKRDPESLLTSKSRQTFSCSVLGEHDESSRLAVSAWACVRSFGRCRMSFFVVS